MVDLDAVFAFANVAHTGQKRKYTGDDYIVHPMAVSRLVEKNGGSDIQVAAALLHDVVEDTPHTLDEIQDLFGPDVTELVKWLTDTSKSEDGNRAIRKGIDRARLAEAPADAQMIKLADMIDNSITIQICDKSFAKVFMAEMKLLIEAMDKVRSTSLWDDANDIVSKHYAKT